jgi:RNA polymerase sigma factor (sigma-70 family)
LSRAHTSSVETNGVKASNERALVAALRAGDEAAFRAVLELHRAGVHAFLARLSGDPELTRELLQVTWLSLAESAPRLSPGTILRAWLFTVARNAYWSHRRWARLDLARVAELALWRRAEVPSPETSSMQAEATRRTERALAALRPKYREALLLVAGEDLDPAEAAKVLGIRAEAFRQRLSRARAELRSVLETI